MYNMHTQVASFILVLITLATPTLQSTTPSSPNYLTSFCISDSGNYTKNGAYHRSIDASLSDLASNSTLSSFYAANNGVVYGRFYCRHDLSLLTCSACVHAATAQIVADFPSYKQAVVWYEQCTLLYLNSTSSLDFIDVASPYDMWYTPKNVSDPNNFNPVLEATMNKIINETAYGTGFATADAEVSASETLYSLAQCVPDRVGLLCERCLRKALRHIDLCCSEYDDMAFFYPNCQLRYTILPPFYDVVSSPPPLQAPLNPPRAASPTPPPSINGSSNDSNQGNGAGTKNNGNVLEFVIVAMVLLLGNQYI